MGIESDQLVYDYLSRVGDVAQQQQLPSGDRMRLVSTLRDEIDRQRGKFGSDSAAAVRRILERIGPPDAVVRAASGNGADRATAPVSSAASPPAGPEPALPEQRGRRTARSRWRKETAEPDPPTLPGQVGASPPHLAGMDELGPSGGEPDWWRVPTGPLSEGPHVPGFVGGVELPAMLKPPPPPEPVAPVEAAPDAAAAPTDGASGALRGLRRRLTGDRGNKTPAGRRFRGFGSPFLLLAAVLLIVGAVLGSWLALAGGWVLAYASRTLSRAEAKWAVFGLPGVVVLGGVVWLWGRTNGRWGEPIPQGAMADALSGVWPVVVKTAAVASAVFLLWRARKR